jgi:tRNA U34 2-thiouridine synthase MnmA/TrmU
MNKKAIALLSGGLDSTLAVKLIVSQGVEVVALNFTSPFCTCTSRARREAGCKHEALRVAKELGIEVKLVPKGKEYLQVVRNPRFGRGTAMNPCIDCRIFMLRKAAAMMDELGASFLITGEVLGQRPMSQHRQAMALIERETGLAGKILRPLSALHFEPTEAEKAGIVDREKLLDISGRGRGRQIELAKGLDINDYPCPAGGCLLTDRNFAARLRDAFEHNAGELDAREIELLKNGRHFRLPSGCKVVIGRDEAENERIAAVAPPEYARLEPVDFPGPAAVATGGAEKDLASVAAAIVRFSPKAPPGARVTARVSGREETIAPDPGFDFAAFKKCALGAG